MKNISTFLLLLISFTAFSQVKVGENPNTINPSAVLEAESTNKGFLPPRMTTAQRDAIQNPAEGLQIYNTTTKCVEVFIAPNWQNMFCGCSSAPANLSYTDNGPLTYCLNAGISPNSASTQASTPSSFTVSPSLPAGLQLNNVNGQITGTPTSLSSSANYTITASNACGSTTRVLNIGVITVPATPPTISGPSAPTINTSTNYSITAVSGATSYTWTVPTGWIINSGQGTTIINVTSGSNAGNVTVTATNTCGTSTASSKTVSSWRPIVATGGTVTNYTANGSNGVNGIQYRVHSFTAVGNSNFNVTDAGSDGQVDYLIIGGGGGGGARHGGGGGAGGYLQGSFNVNNLSYTLSVGQGGQGGMSTGTISNEFHARGTNGQNSAGFNLTAIGGGGGGGYADNGGCRVNGNTGGSGGGGCNAQGISCGNGSGGSGTVGQGFNGASVNSGGSEWAAAGGGGAGGAGISNSSNTIGGAGGAGLSSSITGVSVARAGGGGGGGGCPIGTPGSATAGGAPGCYGCPCNAQSATVNTGGGGGGARDGNGGSGGSGIVIIRYPLSNPNP